MSGKRKVRILGILGLAAMTCGACGEGSHTAGTEHFLLHWESYMELDTDWVEEMKVFLEEAYSFHIEQGMRPLPPDDGLGGDDRADVYINGAPRADPATQSMHISQNNPAGEIRQSRDGYLAVHEMHHLFQFVYLGDNDVLDPWLAESAAQWFSALALDETIGWSCPPSYSEVICDTVNSLMGNPEAGLVLYSPAGEQIPDPRVYHRWILWQYLHQYTVFPSMYERMNARSGPQRTLDALGMVLVEKTGEGIGEHILRLASWALKLAISDNVVASMVPLRLEAGQDLLVEGVACLGYTYARVMTNGRVEARVEASGRVGVGLVVFGAENLPTLSSSSGQGLAVVEADVGAGADAFVIGANLELGLDTCDRPQNLRIQID